MPTSREMVAFTMLFSVTCFANLAQGQFEPWAADTDPKDIPQSHVQDITASPFTYVDSVRPGRQVDHVVFPCIGDHFLNSRLRVRHAGVTGISQVLGTD